MTDSEIIKALECSTGKSLLCRECPYSPRYRPPLCQRAVAKDAISLINRQKAEIESLGKEVDRLSQVVMYNNGVTEMKVTEAVKEFAEKVKESFNENEIYYDAELLTTEYSIEKRIFDNLVKEMVGE